MENELRDRELFIEELKKEIRIWSDDIDIADISGKHGELHYPQFIIKATANFREDTITVAIEVEPERIYIAYVRIFAVRLLKSIKAMVFKSVPKEQRWVFNDRF
jgi:hypothetical protein